MTVSYIVWGVFWLLVFLPLELLGVFHVFGWVSFSETIWSIEKLGPAVVAIVLAFLIVLTSHLCIGWPH